METPAARGTLQEFEAEIESYLSENCLKNESDEVRCRWCWTKTEFKVCYVSIHTTAFDNCSGSGRVKQIPIPYCPNCETEPTQDRSCVHLSPAEELY